METAFMWFQTGCSVMWADSRMLLAGVQSRGRARCRGQHSLQDPFSFPSLQITGEWKNLTPISPPFYRLGNEAQKGRVTYLCHYNSVIIESN